MKPILFTLMLLFFLVSCSDDTSSSTPPPVDCSATPTAEGCPLAPISCGGTEISPASICITTPASFLAIEDALNRDYVLGADLDFTGVEYRPIGVMGPFIGSIDGNGHTISNITYQANASISNDCGAIFCVSAGAPIKNLGIKNVNFTVGADQYSAGLVAQCGTDCVIENIYVNGANISVGSKSSGGLVGLSNGANSTIKNSYIANVVFTDPNSYLPNIGLVVGEIITVSTISFINVYYQNDTALGNVPFGSGLPSVGSSYTGKTLAEMQCAVRDDCASVFGLFDFVGVWTSMAGQNNDLPYLR